jgi:ribonuclease P/MRP protein subunit POP8
METIAQANHKSSKSQTLITRTLRKPQFAYAHLSLLTNSSLDSPSSSSLTPTSTTSSLDAVQVRAYLVEALRRFLGDTGAAIPVDILAIPPSGTDVWVRVPHEDLAAFTAGVTAYTGMAMGQGSERAVLRIVACGDWLGSLIGRTEEAAIWTAPAS